MNATEKKRKEHVDEMDRIWAENEAKGLTRLGYTKTYDNETIEFYINNKKWTCKVSYSCCSVPHMEFRGEPCLLSETGYRSHFMQIDLTEYESFKDAVAENVDYIIRSPHGRNSKDNYTLTWEPSLDYLKHSPEQMMMAL